MISINRLKKEEVSSLKEFLNYLWEDLYGDFLPRETAENLASRWLVPQLTDLEMDNPNLFLAVAKNEIDEIIALALVTKIEYDTIKIDKLYVAPYYQRQGIGKRFLEESRLNFSGIRRIEVEVEEGNYQGRSFYFKYGFKDRKIREENIEDRTRKIILMEKKITG